MLQYVCSGSGSIGVTIKEETEIIEGEVVEIVIDRPATMPKQAKVINHSMPGSLLPFVSPLLNPCHPLGKPIAHIVRFTLWPIKPWKSNHRQITQGGKRKRY